MPVIKPDLTEAVQFTTMEPGTYPAKIVGEVPFQTSKGKGTPMIVPTFEIEYQGKVQTRKAFLPITGMGAGGFQQLLRACGFDQLADAYADASTPADQKPEFNTDDLTGQELNVVVEGNLYEGQMRDQIRTFLKK